MRCPEETRPQVRGARGEGTEKEGPHPWAAGNPRVSPTPVGVGRNWDRASVVHPNFSQTSHVTVPSLCLSFLNGKMRRLVRESLPETQGKTEVSLLIQEAFGVPRWQAACWTFVPVFINECTYYASEYDSDPAAQGLTL